MSALDWILPGVGHWRHGFRPEARKYLFFGALWLLIVVAHFDRILTLTSPAPGKAVENWVALLFLAAWPLFMVWAARRGLRSLLRPAERESKSQWSIALDLLRKNKRAVWGLRVLAVAYIIAFLCPVLAPYDPEHIPPDTLVNKHAPIGSTIYVLGDSQRGEMYCRAFVADPDDPSRVFLDRVEAFAHRRVPLSRLGEPRKGWTSPPTDVVRIGDRDVPYRKEFHLLGTDEVGRDLLSGVIYGSRISLSIGFVAMLIAVLIGSIVGTVAAYVGGWTDFAMMRFVDILMSFPRLLLLMIIYAGYAAAKEQVSIFTIVVILGATGWMGIARLVRAQILSLKEQDFTYAARALGLGHTRIMFRHLLPNATAPLIVDATLRVGNTILLEAALSFLGMGVQKPTPSWGNIVQGGQLVLADAWWIATIPGLAIVFVVVSFNLVGDALRDALDPKLRD